MLKKSTLLLHLPHAILLSLHMLKADVVILSSETADTFGV